MRMKNVISLLMITLLIGCGTPLELTKVAESEAPLFGKMKLWEIEKISNNLYAFRYTFYRNIILIGDDGNDDTEELIKNIDNTNSKLEIKYIKM